MKKKIEITPKTPVRKSTKFLDVKQYRIYTVVQQRFVAENDWIEEHVTLYGKDEDIEFHDVSQDVNCFKKRIKGFVAIPKGSQIPKYFKNMDEYNKALKKVPGSMRIS